MVLVHGLLVILDSRRFSSVEVRRWVGPCTMGESRLTSWIEISRQVSRRLGNRHGKKQRYSPKKKPSSLLIGGEEGSSAEFFEEIRKLLADFNVSIQEESKDRKLRFHVKRLIKSHQQRGEDVDEELDFYMDDDDGDHALAACHTHT